MRQPVALALRHLPAWRARSITYLTAPRRPATGPMVWQGTLGGLEACKHLVAGHRAASVDAGDKKPGPSVAVSCQHTLQGLLLITVLGVPTLLLGIPLIPLDLSPLPSFLPPSSKQRRAVNVMSVALRIPRLIPKVPEGYWQKFWPDRQVQAPPLHPTPPTL